MDTYRQFIFESYELDTAHRQILLHYSFDGDVQLTETLPLPPELPLTRANDPDVQRLRGKIGSVFNGRLGAALGRDADPAVLRALNLAWAGALLQVGMGYFDYAELADRMDEVAGLLLGGGR